MSGNDIDTTTDNDHQSAIASPNDNHTSTYDASKQGDNYQSAICPPNGHHRSIYDASQQGDKVKNALEKGVKNLNNKPTNFEGNDIIVTTNNVVTTTDH